MYAAVRFLHHAGQLGYVDKGLWNKYTNQELRDMLIDRRLHITPDDKNANDYKVPRKWLDQLDMAALLTALGVSSKYIYFLYEDYCTNQQRDTINKGVGMYLQTKRNQV
ncbi:hypothetical protein AGMMS49936_05950 [Endomicrobiia bacterium]|nr:hypothetical protein AGMMS49936_05950 [Endomicrobiia bacterium]